MSIEKKMRQEKWEMINPDYATPMFCPSPCQSECSLSPGRISSASATCPWTLLPSSTLPFQSASLLNPLPFQSAPHIDTDSFRCIASLLNPSGQIYSLAAAAGELLYTGSDSNIIKVWRLPDFEEHGRSLKSGCGNVKALIVAGDKIVSAHGDNKIRVWRRSRSNPTVHRRVATLPTFKIFSNFIKPLVGDNASNGNRRVKHSDDVTCLAYEENDDLLYSRASCDKTVKVWKLSESKCIETIGTQSEVVNAVVVRGDGVVFTGLDDGRVKVWKRSWGHPKHELITTLYVQRSPVKALALDPGSLPIVYAGCSDGYIYHWENDQFSDRVFHYTGFLRSHLHSVLCMATVGDLLLSGSADTTIRVWKRDAGGRAMSCLAVMEGHRGPVRCIVASSHLNRSNVFIAYSGSVDGMVKVWLGCMESNMDSPLTTTDPDHDQNVAFSDDYFVLRKAEEEEA